MRVCGLRWNALRKKSPNPVRYAEQPGQTINVDLCFVPVNHTAAVKLPAVSGSSGRLVVERSAGAVEARQWAGQVFADDRRDYAEVMLDYVARSQGEDHEAASPPIETKSDQNASVKAQQRAWRIAEDQLRVQRRTLRQQRAQEDAAWQALRV